MTFDDIINGVDGLTEMQLTELMDGLNELIDLDKSPATIVKWLLRKLKEYLQPSV